MHSQPETDNEQNKNHNTDIDNNHTMNNSYEHSKQTSKEFQNLQPKRQELLKNQENITTRKTRPTRKQNTSNNEEYWIDNIPPELTEANYPPIINSDNQNQISISNKKLLSFRKHHSLSYRKSRRYYRIHVTTCSTYNISNNTANNTFTPTGTSTETI